MISRIWLLIFFIPFFCISQTLTGRVVDKITQQPLEMVSVYFDNTTVGTATNDNGEFSITYNDAIQSTLVISYLGYEKVLISDYRNQSTLYIELVEAQNILDEVQIAYDDGLTRRQKLRLFRKEFLGTSKFGKSCKILNEDDVFLRYNKTERTLYASSKVPVKVMNKALQYQVEFDIIDFAIKFRYVEASTSTFNIHSVAYYGTSFYKDLENAKKRKAIKSRAKAYKGSVQHFMRSIYNKNIEEEGYWIFYNKFRIDEWSFFTVEPVETSDSKKVTLEKSVSILYDKKVQSELHLEINEFFVDPFGNYTPILGIYFGGAMGSQRVGDLLPSDYGFELKE